MSQSTAWADTLRNRFGTKILSERLSAPGEIEFTVAPSDAHNFLSELKNLEGGAFDHLQDLTAYDDPKSSARFSVVYILVSLLRKTRCLVVVPCVDAAAPSVKSITDLWPGANWLERETFDLVGVNFEGHPDLRRILLPPSFKGHPLRKDFIVDYRQTFPKASSASQVFDPFKNTIVDLPKGSS